MTYDGASTVTLNDLNAGGGINGPLGTITIGAGETPSVDAFRCVPYGSTCFFPTESSSGGGESFLYNVSTGGALIAKTPLGAVRAHNVHARKDGGGALLIVLDPASGDISVVQVLGNALSAPLVNLTSSIPPSQGWAVLPGSSTQCSNNETLWVAASHTGGGGGMGRLVKVDVLGGRVMGVVDLQFSGFYSLWADCNDRTGVDILGGTVLHVSASGRALVYGTVGAGGVFVPGPTVALPPSTPPLAPNGLLTLPETGDLMAALYPEGAAQGAGVLAFADFTGSAWTLKPVDYFLWGAARWE